MQKLTPSTFKNKHSVTSSNIKCPLFFLTNPLSIVTFHCRQYAYSTLILQEAFSLLAYADPWDSPVGGQLNPAGREPVCAQLNSAILGMFSLQ